MRILMSEWGLLYVYNRFILFFEDFNYIACIIFCDRYSITHHYTYKLGLTFESKGVKFMYQQIICSSSDWFLYLTFKFLFCLLPQMFSQDQHLRSFHSIESICEIHCYIYKIKLLIIVSKFFLHPLQIFF